MEGKRYIIKNDSLSMKAIIAFERPKSFSVIALNLETVEDVEKVIRQCDSIKEQMTGELHKLSINKNGNLELS